MSVTFIFLLMMVISNTGVRQAHAGALWDTFEQNRSELGYATTLKLLAQKQASPADLDNVLKALTETLGGEFDIGLDPLLLGLARQKDLSLRGAYSLMSMMKHRTWAREPIPEITKKEFIEFASLVESRLPDNRQAAIRLAIATLRTSLGFEPGDQLQDKDLGLVKVGSDYNDDLTKTKINSIFGTANLIDVVMFGKVKKVLITAAHLVDGRAPWFELDGRKSMVRPEQMLVNNDLDVAVIELRGEFSISPAMVATQNGRGFDFDLGPGLVKSIMAQRQLGTLHDLLRSNGGLWFTREPDWFFMPSPRWSQPAHPAKKNNQRYLLLQLTKASNGSQVFVGTSSEMGMSGAFGVWIKREEKPEIIGLLSQTKRYFDGSYFATPQAISQVLSSFVQRQRGRVSKTRWFSRSGLTYRVFEGGIREVSVLNQPTGNGMLVDPGSTDQKTAKDEALPEVIEKIFDVRPGIDVKQKRVIGIELTDKSDSSNSFVLYANAQAVQYAQLVTTREKFNVRWVEPGEPLLPMALKKAKYAFKKTISQEILRPQFKLDTQDHSDAQQGTLDVTPEGLKVALLFSIDYRMSLPVSFQLDAYGRLLGRSEFQPLVSIPREAGQGSFVLDLRWLFFTDLNEVLQNGGTESSLPTLFTEALEFARSRVEIHLQAPGVFESRTYRFAPIDCDFEKGGVHPNVTCQGVNHIFKCNALRKDSTAK